RGSGSVGVADSARAFLATLSLEQFSTDDPVRFRRRLDEATSRLRDHLPPPANSWGLARKCVNVFLRDAFYNYYLRTAFGLDLAEALYEVPLDNVVATALKREGRPGQLPQWNGLRHLTAPMSDRFQGFASELAAKRETARVHLDAILWTLNRSQRGVRPSTLSF
ncbi:MAG TPA: hypothetical protein VHG93_16205, partial [Longimicrobium sp.]|nr:hypothetical protein [Longimicrobium sp.]